MKKLLFPLLLALPLAAKDDTYVGLGPYFQTQPYKDADPVVLASPVIFFDNSLFYIRWTRVGMYFMGNKSDDYSWGISVTAQPQILGYYESDSFGRLNSRDKTPILAGMDERESSWEGGIAAGIENAEGWYAEAVALYDLLDEYNGLKLRLEIGRSWKQGRWQFVPSLLAVWLSQPFANYYYGVPGDEADPAIGRPAYRADAALNLAVQAYLKYDIDTHWHLLGNLRADRLAGTIYDSPLVGTRYFYSGMLSVLYSFDLFGKERAVHNPK